MTTDQDIVAFVILPAGGDAGGSGASVADELGARVTHEIGPIARPGEVLVVPELPKTRSVKIMRRLLRDLADNRSPGDATTLTDSSAGRDRGGRHPVRGRRRLTVPDGGAAVRVRSWESLSG
ncbi:hypothetical protein ACIRVF_22705 [Kitasatospora sp. NPDC101157]|uniref:AMP-binding enzyme n=1 Tax=Kitasatospora sp. NPDC101157 TaxID=3364098 RepID=UPI0038277A86